MMTITELRPVPSCPAERFAREAAETARRLNEADGRILTQGLSPGDHERAELAFRGLSDRLEAISSASSFVRPSTLAGAAFQAMQAEAEIEEMHSWHGSREAGTEARVDRLYRSIERRMRGIIDLLEAVSGVPIADLGADYFYSRRRDPFAPFDGGPAAPGAARQPDLESPTDHVEVSTPLGPVFASTDDQLLVLARRYDELEDLYLRAGEHEEASGTTEAPGRASAHFLRQQNETLILMSGLHASTVRQLGLKARVVAHCLGDWWGEDPSLDRGERACRALLDDILTASGVTRTPVRDFSPEELLAA